MADLIAGKIEVPLPTYFALGRHGLPDSVVKKLEADAGELCHNLFFLGKRTTIKTSEGIRIVALGGKLDPNLTVGVSKDKYPPYYSEGDAKALKGANSADILITTEWPAGLEVSSSIAMPSGESALIQLQCLSELVSALKPRYHFSTSGDTFYEREPFFHAAGEEDQPGYNITRFISLASYGNPGKAKWIYAFSLDPSAAPPTAIPPGTTASPFTFAGKKRPAVQEQSHFRFDKSGGDHRQGPWKGRKRQKTAPPTPGECFFCLSNPNVETHLIAAIGEDAYITTAKGPLPTASTFPQLDFPGHILIIPLTHSPTLGLIEEPETRQKTYSEMQRFREAMNNMLSSKAKHELGSVTWEVSRGGGIHTHWQYMPVQADLVRRGLVEAAFKVQAENEKYPHLLKQDVKDGSDEAGDFFRLVIWQPSVTGEDTKESIEKGKDMHYVLPLDASFRFDLQFGRRVMAKLLGLETRMQWQDCGQSHSDEVADVEAFKKAFEQWDFSA